MISGYKTAISRKQPSAPLKYLESKKLIKYPILDFGCGRGMDAEYLGNKGETESYDPYWNPIDLKDRKFRTILCTYVLNVMQEDDEADILEEIKSHLEINGSAFISVRRDFKENYKTKNGTQRIVKLNLDIIVENNNFCIYHLKNETKIGAEND